MWNIKKIISKGDYNHALVPEHPNTTGRLLDKSEVTHHINNGLTHELENAISENLLDTYIKYKDNSEETDL